MSCGDDYTDSYAPVYGKMVFAPTRAILGDSVTVTVEQAQKGHGLEKTTYTWSFKYGYETEDGAVRDTTEVFTQHTNYDGTYDGDPTIRFLVPANCASRNISVSLYATFSGYIGNALFLQANKSGTLVVQ